MTRFTRKSTRTAVNASVTVLVLAQVAGSGALRLQAAQAAPAPAQAAPAPAQAAPAQQNESVTAAAAARAGAPATAPRDVPADALAAQRPVARLSRLSGAVTVGVENGTEPPVDAALNMPLVGGSRLITGDNGEAEVEFADGSVLRITSGSAATLSRLDPASQGTQLVLGSGLFYLELRASEVGAYAVSAGDVTISPEENASVRVRVDDAQVETALLAGSVSVTRANAYTAQLSAGESLRTDPRNGKRYLLADTISPEAWDSWNERLAQAAQDQQGARTTARDGYTGDQGYGWADLDAQGSWYSVPGEGEVWQPAIADGSFDPYGSGSWVYGPGGYTWASGYGWGWLPYRCGAWSFYNGFGWGWSPSAGCLNFGFGGGFGGGYDGGYEGGGGGGGYRVRHPPVWWHPPHRPAGSGGVGRHPTVPLRPRPLDATVVPPPHRLGEPVRLAGVLATPLPRVGRSLTPQGGSAVGSSLLRDFPVRAGTHEAVLGVVSGAPVATPGRPGVWRQQGTAGVGIRNTVGDSGGVRGNASATSTHRRLPQPSDPPVGANGAPPLGAAGAPPFGGSTSTPFGGSSATPFGAGTSTPVAGTGVPGTGRTGTTQGELRLRQGGSTDGRGSQPLPPTSLQPRVAPGQPPSFGIAPRPVAPVSVPRIAAPAPPPPAPHLSAPPSAPQVSPAPAAPAAARPR